MPYLSVAAYIARWGMRETTILTAEEPGATEPDEPKVEGAIADAEALANGYIARGRNLHGVPYAVPLADPPGPVLAIVADLARERLHKDRPTPEVTAAADRARAQLRDIAAGRLTLLLDEPGGPDATSDNLSQSSGDAQPLTLPREALDRFSDLGRGYGVARWKQ